MTPDATTWAQPGIRASRHADHRRPARNDPRSVTSGEPTTRGDEALANAGIEAALIALTTPGAGVPEANWVARAGWCGSRPVVDRRRRRAEGGGEGFEVVGVAGEHVVAKS